MLMRVSTLGFALLGLLARREMTGYQLAAALKRPVGYFWSAGHSQIYPELRRLEQRSLVRFVVVDGPGPRDTKRYFITGAGRAALAEWVVQPPGPAEGERSELLLKVYSSWAADRTAVVEMVRGERRRNLQLLERFEELRAEHEAEWAAQIRDPGSEQFGSYAALRAGLSFQRHVESWFDWLIGVLEGAESDPARDLVPDPADATDADAGGGAGARVSPGRPPPAR